MVGIGEAEFPTGQPVPTFAAVAAAIEADAGGHENRLGTGWQQHDLMDVAVSLVLGARIAVELAPGPAAVGRLEQRALLDRGKERVGIARVESQHLEVGDVRRRRKGPALRARHLANRRQLLPALAVIDAAEERSRLRTGIDYDPSPRG